MEIMEIRNLSYFFVVLLILPTIFILTKVVLGSEKVRNFITKKSNENSFQIDGYEKQSYFILHPNNICYLRIVLVGFSFLFYLSNFKWLGIILFYLAAATDFVDGSVARSCRLETKWGKMLDPLCDKIFYFPYFFYFAIKRFFPVYVVILFLIWDLGIGQIVTRKILIHYGFSAKSKIFGKVKTIICIACLTLCFIFDVLQLQTAKPIVEILIGIFFYTSLTFSVFSVLEKLKGILSVKNTAFCSK